LIMSAFNYLLQLLEAKTKQDQERKGKIDYSCKSAFGKMNRERDLNFCSSVECWSMKIYKLFDFDGKIKYWFVGSSLLCMLVCIFVRFYINNYLCTVFEI
jgi:hypothetical protein